MKFCPACQTRYDEEILRFCIKDGTPLVEETSPQFTELPSESMEDDPGEITIIRKTSVPEPPPFEDEREMSESPRLVIPTTEQPRTPQAPPPRQRRRAGQETPPPQPNIFKVIVLTILGTLIVLAGIGLLVWSLRGDNAANANSNQNSNLNANVDTNLNTNLNMNGFNMNTNTNLNWNVNFNVNANMNVNTNVNANANKANANVNVNAAPRPSPSPTPTPAPANTAPANKPAANKPAAANTSQPSGLGRPRSVNRL